MLVLFRKVLLVTVLLSSFLLSQGGMTALPFLQIGTSLSGNGMGEIRGSANTGSALMGTFNPGLLGVQSFTTRFNSEIFTRRTNWLPVFRLPDLTITSHAVTAGIVLDDENIFPIPLALGAGYSNTYLNLGEFIITSETSPEAIGTFRGYERVDALSFGAAVRFGALFGVGLNFKRIHSRLSPIGTAQEAGDGTATPYAVDIGTYIDIPIMSPPEFKTAPDRGLKLYPNLSMSIAYVYGNIGSGVRYIQGSQPDPLPREITAGFSFTGGLTMDLIGTRIPLAEILFVREAQDIAVIRTGNDWSYQYGLGNINVNDNLIRGKTSVRSTLRKGGAVTLFGMLTFREGSHKMDSRDFTTTEGTEIHLTGIFRFLTPFFPVMLSNPSTAFIFDHLQISYIHSRYTGIGILNGTNFEGVMISFK